MQIKTKIKKIILAEPRGFCAGVNRAIDIVNIALDIYGAPLYVRHEIVHNHHVVQDFRDRGVIFVESLDEVPDNSALIFSAHGTAPDVIDAARKRGLQFIDAVCPLVTKVHLEIMKAIKEGKKVFYIGHRGHQEVLGAMGYSQNNLDTGTKESYQEQFNPRQSIFLIEKVEEVSLLKQALGDVESIVATQTTLSVDDTKAIMDRLALEFPRVELPRSDDICYATQNRQDAVKELVKISDYILIIGSKTSSNTLRLLELAKNLGKEAELVPDPEEFKLETKHLDKTIGISSGASAPEFLVDILISKLLEDDKFEYAKGSDKKYSSIIEKLVIKEEKVSFPLPKELSNEY
jgi:4-hydroxy-3-methylbut-2-en-1-yl diphosphate reductase